MTREDALKIWLPIIQMGVEDMPECKEALDIAIKALEQEPFKPMVEIDLDYVIKQKYIERGVLDKIIAEIAEIPKKYPMTMDYENGLKEALGIIDKYKAETEDA